MWRDARTKQNSTWDGVHSKRFSCWRWEAQSTALKENKDGKSSNTKDNTGMATSSAEHRNMENEQYFGKTTAVAAAA